MPLQYKKVEARRSLKDEAMRLLRSGRIWECDFGKYEVFGNWCLSGIPKWNEEVWDVWVMGVLWTVVSGLRNLTNPYSLHPEIYDLSSTCITCGSHQSGPRFMVGPGFATPTHASWILIWSVIEVHASLWTNIMIQWGVGPQCKPCLGLEHRLFLRTPAASIECKPPNASKTFLGIES